MYGEGFYGPAGDNMVAPKATQRPDDFAQWGRIAREIAKAGLPIHAHTTLEGTRPDGFLNQIEQIHKEFPVKQPALGVHSRRSVERRPTSNG